MPSFIIILLWVLSILTSMFLSGDGELIRSSYAGFDIDWLRPPTWAFGVAWSTIVVCWCTLMILSLKKGFPVIWWGIWGAIMVHFALFQYLTFITGMPYMFALMTGLMDLFVAANILLSYPRMSAKVLLLWVPSVLWLCLATVLSIDLLI